MLVPLQILGYDPSTWIVLLIAAFAGGAFGAALGALPAFIFTGFMVIAGETVNILGKSVGQSTSGEASTLGSVGITGSIAFGPVFSPAISFAGGAAAAAYAAKKGYIQSGFDYHNAKDIGFALGTRPDVLVVGGVFGIIGLVLTQLSTAFSAPWDPIAMGVVLSALIHRLVFGYSVVGYVKGGILDMGPFEREERRALTDAGTAAGGSGDTATDGGAVDSSRFVVEPWLPHQYKWANVAAIGLFVGILAAFTALRTGSYFLAFGISAASLVFLNCGVDNIPVTHHISLPASTAALAMLGFGAGGDGQPALQSDALLSATDAASGALGIPAAEMPVMALLVGGLFGMICALFGELFQRIFYAHGDTHWDPPAAAIVFGTFVIAVCYLAGVLPAPGWVPIP
ncbi:hypothetical protein [Haloarchaeobius sp. DFWS5]|uniref:hypothetical protein n=1 Tax=Haloarchaeobius sp. DFWS5 TaxID=3446114 RepID=UPI003EBF199E